MSRKLFCEISPFTYRLSMEKENRNGQVYRDVIDRVTGRCLESQLIRTNHAKVMYDLPPSISIQEQ